MRFDQILSLHPKKILWGLCLLVVGLMVWGLLASPLIPYWNGQLEVERTFAMTGLLQAENFSSLRKCFLTPQISILTPQTLVYMFSYLSGNDLRRYVIFQLVFTYVPLAWGILELSKLLNRRGWAPALFLMTLGNNISLDYPHVLDLNTQMMALASICLVFQVRWHVKPTARNGALFGGFLGLGFWIAPQTAFLLATTFLVSEVLMYSWEGKSEKLSLESIPVLATMLILAFPAVWIDQGRQILECFNFTVSESWVSVFPASLTLYYDMEMLLVLAIVVFLGFKCLAPTTVSAVDKESAEEDFPVTSEPVIKRIGYFFVSAVAVGFVLTQSNHIPLDDWMFVLPMGWVLLFSLMASFRVGSTSITAFAGCWFVMLGLQLALGWHNERFVANLTLSPDVDPDWNDRMPLAWSTYQDSKIMDATALTIREVMPNVGTISLWSSSYLVNSARLRWTLNQYPNSYYFVTPVTTTSQEYDPRLMESQAIVIYDPSRLAGTSIDRQTIRVLYRWLDKQCTVKKVMNAKVVMDGAENGTIYFLKQPINLSEMDELKKSCEEEIQAAASSQSTIDTKQ